MTESSNGMDNISLEVIILKIFVDGEKCHVICQRFCKIMNTFTILKNLIGAEICFPDGSLVK